MGHNIMVQEMRMTETLTKQQRTPAPPRAKRAST